MSVLAEVLLVLVVEDSRGEIGEIKVHLPISHHKGARFFLDVHSYLFPKRFILRIGTLISLINVEVGINVEGVQNLPNH